MDENGVENEGRWEFAEASVCETLTENTHIILATPWQNMHDTINISSSYLTYDIVMDIIYL